MERITTTPTLDRVSTTTPAAPGGSADERRARARAVKERHLRQARRARRAVATASLVGLAAFGVGATTVHLASTASAAPAVVPASSASRATPVVGSDNAPARAVTTSRGS